MKVQPYQIDNVINNIGNQFISALIYGPDYGVKSDIIDNIVTKFLSGNPENKVINLDFSNQNEACDVMFSELLNYDLIPVKKVIKVKSVTAKIVPTIQTIIGKSDQINKEVFIVLLGDDIDTKSSLRFLYEKDPSLLAIACYPDTIEDSTKIVSTFLAQNGIQFEPKVPRLVASYFTQDRVALKNELLKIKTYLKEKPLTVELCQKIVDESLSYAADILVDSIGLGDVKNAISELDLALFEGNNPVGIIRIIMNHFLKIKEMLLNIKNNNSTIEQEITKNHIFFKRVVNYRKQLSCLTIIKVDVLLKKLLKLETELKMHSEDAGVIILKNELLQL